MNFYDFEKKKLVAKVSILSHISIPSATKRNRLEISEMD